MKKETHVTAVCFRIVPSPLKAHRGPRSIASAHPVWLARLQQGHPKQCDNTRHCGHDEATLGDVHGANPLTPKNDRAPLIRLPSIKYIRVSRIIVAASRANDFTGIRRLQINAPPSGRLL
jgi:hypothetical protein